jgi:Holliday junction DNA helicase RuvB
VGATTKAGSLSGPLRDRFGVTHRLHFYKLAELKEITKKAAEKLAVVIDEESLIEIAKRARGTPRTALRLLKRLRDFAQVKGKGIITKNLSLEALLLLQVDELGLDTMDIQYLQAIITMHKGGPVGLETIASSIAEDMTTIEEIIEPYLLQIGFLKKTPRGRMTTETANKHVKIHYMHILS